MKIGEEADSYQPPTTKNIADLGKISVDVEVHNGEGGKEGEKFQYKYIEEDKVQYRVPGIVLGHLKALRKQRPQTKFFSVTREGSGKTGTKYYVFPEE